MTLFEYIEAMKELDSPVATAAVVMLCLFLVAIIINMLSGMRRGTLRQGMRTGMTLLAAMISYGVAVIVSNSIIGGTDAQSIEDFIVFMESKIPGLGDLLRQALSSFDPEVFEYFIILPATIILVPLLATVIFLLINLILKIVRAVLNKIFGFKKAKKNSQRLGGALIGAVEAIIWVIMVTLPITGIISLADRACNQALSSEDGAENTELITTYEEIVRPFSDNPAFDFIDALGSGAMADGIATIKVNGESTNLREEIVSVVHIGLVEIPALEGADFAALTDENKESLDNIIASLDRSPFIATIVSRMIQSSSGFMNSDIIPFDKEGEGAEIFDGIMLFLEGVTEETLFEDVSTIKSVYYVISDSQIIKELEDGDTDIVALLQEKRKAGDDTVNQIVNILQGNERTAPIIKAMTQALLSSLSTEIEAPDGSTITVSYDSVKNSMNDVLAVDKESYENEEEYKEALTDTLDTALRNNGIELEEEIVESIADYVDTEYSDVEELTDEQFNDLLLYYYDAYLEYVQDGLV